MILPTPEAMCVALTTDIAVVSFGPGGICTYLSSELANAKVFGGDFNGDGKTDIAIVAPGAEMPCGGGTFHVGFFLANRVGLGGSGGFDSSD